MKKVALFDIDGVIYDGHSIFDLIQEQEKNGFIKKGLWNLILGLLEKYKKGNLTYKEAADQMLLLHSQSLFGKSYDDLVNENLNFIKKHHYKIFPYFTHLIQKLKKTHDIYFITTNFDISAEAFTKYFGLSGFLSSKITQENGVIVGGVELSLAGNKVIAKDLVNKYGKSGSIAVGDSENDVDMLKLVEFAFVMEPDNKMKLIADEKKWKIVDRNTITQTVLNYER